MKVRHAVAGLLVLLAGAAMFGYYARTSGPRIARIAWVNFGPAAPNAPNVAAFRERMRELGRVEGRNMTIDFRWGDQQVERLPALVAKILALEPDVIVATGGAPTVLAVKAAKPDVPVVFITGDPIGEGVVGSLARPGGNLTGFAVIANDLDAKRLEVLRQALPGAARVAVIWNPANRITFVGKAGIEAVAAGMGMTIEWREARNTIELDAALASLPVGRVDAMLVVADPMLGFERKRIVEFANRNRIPGVYFWREFVLDGGFSSYGPSLTAIHRRAAEYVDLILKGAKPGDLPIQQPTTFELVLNRGTARSLGITIPDSLLLRATEIIE